MAVTTSVTSVTLDPVAKSFQGAKESKMPLPQ
jgi:hypothetical protein